MNKCPKYLYVINPSQQNILNIKVQVSSMDQQRQTIDFYESNHRKIMELQNEIARLKELEIKYIFVERHHEIHDRLHHEKNLFLHLKYHDHVRI